MSDIKSYIDKIFCSDLKKAVISKPKDKQSEFKKITVNPLKDGFQIAKYTEKQVFHENVKKENLADRICNLADGVFLQINAWAGEKEILTAFQRCLKGNGPMQASWPLPRGFA